MLSKIRYSLICSLVILALVLMPCVFSLATSLQGAKMILRDHVYTEGETLVIPKFVTVANTNDFSIIIHLEPEKHYEKIITIIDNDFVMQPGESRKANFEIALKSGGNYSGKILISFSPEDPESKEASLGMASNVIILAKGPVNDFYYDVMENDDEDELSDLPNESDTTEINDTDTLGENTEEDSQDNANNIDASTTDSTEQPDDSDKDNKPQNMFGILTIAIIILLAISVVLVIISIIKKLKQNA